jgi:hypothetical protein
LNAGLVRAIDVADAERIWIGGNDTFSDVMREPCDMFAEQSTQMMFKQAFS